MKVRDVLTGKDLQEISALERKMKNAKSVEEYNYYKTRVGYIIKTGLTKQKAAVKST